MVSISPDYGTEAERFSWPAKGDLGMLGAAVAVAAFGGYALLHNYVRMETKNRPEVAAAYVKSSLFSTAFGLNTTLHNEAYQEYLKRWTPNGTVAIVHRSEFDWMVKEAGEKLATSELVRTHATFQSASLIATGRMDLSQWVILCAWENDPKASADMALLPREVQNVDRIRKIITGQIPEDGGRTKKIKRCDALGWLTFHNN